MTREELEALTGSSPALRLLRSDSDNLLLCLHFFYVVFKDGERREIPASEFVSRLDAYLEAHEEHFSAPAGGAAYYLEQWCNEERRFLRRYFTANSDEPVVELSPHVQKLLVWLEELGRRDFVGTESRLSRIFSLLEEIVAFSSDDPELRLERLEKEKLRIETEIERITTAGVVGKYSGIQVIERFKLACSEARRLLADFGEVEDNFKILSAAVQQRYLREECSKGSLVEYVLDADEELKESSQGRSFHAFWEFLCSPTKQDELKVLIDELYQVEEVREIERPDFLLRRLKQHLTAAGDRVLQSNHRLHNQLRRALEDRYALEGRRAAELILEIKSLALGGTRFQPEDKIVEIETIPEISSIMERPWWRAKEQIRFSPAKFTLPEPVELDELFDQFSVDLDECRRLIGECLLERSSVTLAELCRLHPITKGISEVLAYLRIAAEAEETGRHSIETVERERIQVINFYHEPPLQLEVTVPKVLFAR